MAGVVSHLVYTGVTEVAEKVAVVESRHCELGKCHLQESRESREDACLVGVKAETSGSRQVASLL